MSNKKIWDYRITKKGKLEPQNAFKFFREYLLLGESRSFVEVAELTGRTVNYLHTLSERWDWVERSNAYDMWLIEENKREYEEEIRERYRLANCVGLEGLEVIRSLLGANKDLKHAKTAVDSAAKLVKRESAVELESKPSKFSNLTGEELGDIFLASINKASGGYPFKEEEKEDGEDGE